MQPNVKKEGILKRERIGAMDFDLTRRLGVATEAVVPSRTRTRVGSRSWGGLALTCQQKSVREGCSPLEGRGKSLLGAGEFTP